MLALEEQLRGANDKERRRVLNKWYKDTMKAKKAEQILRNQIRSDREPQDASEDDAAHGARPPPRREKTQQDTGRRGGERGRGGVYRQFDKLPNSSAGEDDSEDAASPARGGFDGGATRGRGGGGATVGGGGETSKAAAAATAAAAAVNGAGAGGETDGAAAAAAAAAAAVTGAGATADGGRGGGGGGVEDGRKRRGPPSTPCPIQTDPPGFAPNGRLLDEFLPISPRRRGLSIRELVSTLLVTSQHPRVLRLLPPGCLGLESCLLLKDGQLTALYEHFFQFPPGELGPGGRRQPPFTFKHAFLDRPSPAATEAAQRLLADARTRLRGLDPERDRAYADCIFQSLFRELLEGAGRSPLSPDKDGWVDVRKEPVLTAALGSFATHCGGTVGQALKAVAWASEGVVYDCQGNKAAPCYQQRLMIGAIDADKSHIQHAAAAATASATATNAAAEAEGERRFISIQCHTQGTQATVFVWYSVVKLTVIIGAHSSVRWDRWLYRYTALRPLAWLLERTISTPATHFAHHALTQDDGIGHYMGNYGNLLFFWDVLFGTARITRQYPPAYGLNDDRRHGPERWYHQLYFPFVRSTRAETVLGHEPHTPID